MKNRKPPILNHGQGNGEVTISRKRCILGHLKTILVVLWGGQDTLMVIQYSGPDSRRKKYISYYCIIGSIFAFSSYRFIKTWFRWLLARFFDVGLSELGYPHFRFSTSHQITINKRGPWLSGLSQQTRNLFLL